MKVHLMLPEDAPKPANLLVLARDALKADLELNVILDNISKGDKFIRTSCLSALMAPLQDLKLLEYRHAVLADAMAHPDVIRALYDLCLEAEKRRKATAHWMTNYYLSSTYSGAIDYLINFTETLQKLRQQAEANQSGFRSTGFTDLFNTLREELPEYVLRYAHREPRRVRRE